MCVVSCDTDFATEDADTIYLAWENGRYAPAPPLLYVPGLKAIFQKHSERTKWQPASRDLAGTCALPGTDYAGNAPSTAQKAITSVESLHITPQDISRHKLCYQLASLAFATSTGSRSNTNGGDSCRLAQASGGSKDENPDFSSRSRQLYGSAGHTTPPYCPPSQGDSPSLTPHSTADGDVKSQNTPQKPNPESFNARLPLAELPSPKAQNKYRLNTMPLTAMEKQPALGVTVSKSVTPQRQRASKSSATSLKSILKSSSSCTSVASQGRPLRKGSVHFVSDLKINETRVGTTAVKWPRRLPSPLPRATRSISRMQQHPQRLSSSDGKASSQLVDVRARLANGTKGINRNDRIIQRTQRPEAKTPQRSAHQKLTMENLAEFPDQIEAGGRGLDRIWEEEDDTASNTDFELAVRMKRRWI